MESRGPKMQSNQMDRLKKLRDKLANSGEYSEGESTSSYLSEIDAFVSGWNACAVEYRKIIKELEKDLKKIVNHDTLDGEKYNSHSSAYDGLVLFAEKSLSKIQEWRSVGNDIDDELYHLRFYDRLGEASVKVKNRIKELEKMK